MTGGGGSGPAGGLSQTFSYDPFGNMTESGSFGFSQSFGINNQINGYLYDANGNQTTDIYGQGLTFDANGMLSSVAGNAETYIYDPSGNRAEVHGATVTDYVYFGGIPIASLSGGLYTDLVYGGNTLLAEVGGWQAAFPTYRATDHLGSLVGDLGSSSSGGPVNYAPYGQLFSGSTADPYGYTGLQWDPTTATSHAMARQYSSQQGRWQSPDRYEGSYSWNDPQSLNRYSYVHNNPMGFIDPTGQIIQVPILDPGAAASEVTTAGEIAVGLSATALVIGIDLLITDLIDYLHRSQFHGSLEPRPTAGLWDDSFGIPYPGLNGAIGGALGLPSGGCEFGACNFQQGNGPSTPTTSQTEIVLQVSFDLGLNLLKSELQKLSRQAPYNGNVWSGFTPQDGVCSTGPLAGSMNSNPAILACCQAHDACYTKYSCNASSWLPFGIPGACSTTCNATAVGCIANAK